MSKPSSKPSISRRDFLGGAAAVAATISIVPSHVLGGPGKTAPSDQFNVAFIGAGGKARANIGGSLGAGGRAVAFADPDDKRAAATYKRFKKEPKFKDYRKMFDKMAKDIDGVVVSTPDHTHACAAMAAMRLKKHVYLEKPLARTVHECQVLMEAARKYGVMTQMGNQGHSGRGLPQTLEYLEAGAIGDVKEVYTWSDRPGGWWPQGMTAVPKKQDVPATLDWDVWLGPVAKRPFNDAYVPFKWRGWWDFGCGAMGDMACHNMDPAFMALKLAERQPEKIVATCKKADIAYPEKSKVEYWFPAWKNFKAVKLTWLDGKGHLPPRPEGMDPKRKIGSNGCMFIGEDGVMMGGSHAQFCRIVAGKNVKGFQRPAKKYHRSRGHYKEWIEAAKGIKIDGKIIKPGSNFDYAAPMTQAILAGCIALRFPGEELKWDGKKMRFTNKDQANAFLHYKYRQGWSL